MVITVISILGFIGYIVLIMQLVRRKEAKGESYFSLDMLPEFPKSCKLYYEKKLGRNCKRCTAAGKESELVIRMRYLLSKDSGGKVLKVKDLTHVYHCATCGYKGLYLTKDKRIDK